MISLSVNILFFADSMFQVRALRTSLLNASVSGTELSVIRSLNSFGHPFQIIPDLEIQWKYSCPGYEG